MHLFGELLEEIEADTIQYISEGNQYFIAGISDSVHSHLECNCVIQDNPNVLENNCVKGALAQLTAASYTGGFGKKLSTQLSEADLIYILASDPNDTRYRVFHMKAAYEKLAKELFGLF